jgi:hypothetical protein
MARRTTSSFALPFALLLVSPLLIGAIGFRTNFDARLLAAQNRARGEVGVSPMTWNDRLAMDARAWADQLAASGRFEHSPDEPNLEPQGENLWAGTPGAYQPESMVELWTDEKQDYRPGVFPNNSRSGDVAKVSHYTQLIWRETTQVGCSMARGQREEILVCRYSAPGNVIGQRPI